MIFGRIDYLNLLPFYLFLKRYRPHMLHRSNFKKGPPSAINSLYKRRAIDAGFISSIRSRGQKGANLWIIARKAVTSVLVLEGEFKADNESETSNALAKLLGLRGRVAIGDKALKLYSEGAKAVDLALEWQTRYKMPFVFSRLCYTSGDRLIKKIEKQFLRRMTRRVPQSILQDRAKKSGIPAEEIAAYLNRLEYRIDKRAAMALKKFLFLARGI
jgi:chorismate dehydratase